MASTLRKEVLVLVALVVVVDAIFVAAYFLGRLRSASDAVKVAFTVLWTLITLAVVIRGLYRARSVRVDRAGARRSQ